MVPPARRFYQLTDEQKFRKCEAPFFSSGPLGIMLTDHPVCPILMKGNGDCIEFNEPENVYGLKVASLVMEDMRRRKRDDPEASKNRTGERLSFDRVMKAEAAELAELLDVEEEQMTSRRLTAIWNVMCGFKGRYGNPDAKKGKNCELDKILLEYAKIRLGTNKFDVDEFGAATQACFTYYLGKIKDNKHLGTGVWTLPLVHLLHGHMVERGCQGIQFHCERDRDDSIRANQRQESSRVLWDGKKEYRVESREEMIQWLHEFADEIMEVAIDPIPDDVPRVENATEEVERPAKRVRRPLLLH